MNPTDKKTYPMKLKSLIRLLVIAVIAMTGTTANAQFLKKLGDAVKKRGEEYSKSISR